MLPNSQPNLRLYLLSSQNNLNCCITVFIIIIMILASVFHSYMGWKNYYKIISFLSDHFSLGLSCFTIHNTTIHDPMMHNSCLNLGPQIMAGEW